MGRDRAAANIRPRYSRIGAAATSVLVTLVAILGAVGLLPVSSAAQPPTDPSGASARTSSPQPEPTPASGEGAIALSGNQARPRGTDLPPASGSGRRIVFDMGAQRVWLVGQRHGLDVVRRTYLVSGSLTDNLRAGTYQVYSRSEHAVGVDDSGTMRYMVRFAHGANAAIGFHDIPVLAGRPVQGRDELGSARSHGCIRQWRPDARALWRFAPVGTKVVVV